ncbi:MAG: hypothetical protein AB8H80_00125 [Planctomycetota bacterium]
MVWPRGWYRVDGMLPVTTPEFDRAHDLGGHDVEHRQRVAGFGWAAIGDQGDPAVR